MFPGCLDLRNHRNVSSEEEGTGDLRPTVVLLRRSKAHVTDLHTVSNRNWKQFLAIRQELESQPCQYPELRHTLHRGLTWEHEKHRTSLVGGGLWSPVLSMEFWTEDQQRAPVLSCFHKEKTPFPRHWEHCWPSPQTRAVNSSGRETLSGHKGDIYPPQKTRDPRRQSTQLAPYWGDGFCLLTYVFIGIVWKIIMEKPFSSSAQTGISPFDILLRLSAMTETKII